MKKVKSFYTYLDLNVSDYFLSATRTVSESDIFDFAGLTSDFNELHTSIVFANNTTFGKRIAHGLLILAIANGLYMRLGLFESSVFLGIENWKSTKPVFIGDTIQLKLTIVDKRVTKNGKQAIIGMRYDVLNQDGVVVAEGKFNRMIKIADEKQV